jgi:hypothetical protein
MKIALFALAIFTLCVTAYCYSKIHDEETDYCKLVQRLQSQHGREMEKQGYCLTMRGRGIPGGSIHALAVGFESKKTPTIVDARALYVPAAEHFLAIINQDMAIRPFLYRYPFTIDDLDYDMGFPHTPVDTSGVWPIAYVFCSKGTLYYSVYDPSIENDNPLKTVYKEPYSEALRIVREAGLLPDEHTHR